MSEEENEDIQEEALAYSLKNDMMQEGDSRAAYDNIALQNKLIEPDNTLSGDIAVSNLQLGNISASDYEISLHEVNFAIDCMDMPYECGGFFLHAIGMRIMKKTDIAHIMSGSKDAMKWNSLTQDKKVNVLRKETVTNKRGVNIFKK